MVGFTLKFQPWLPTALGIIGELERLGFQMSQSDIDEVVATAIVLEDEDTAG